MARETLKALRQWGADRLREEDVDGAALDARLLLQFATGLAHEDLAAGPERAVDGELFRTLINRRAGHEPVSRIVGSREFHGRDFLVTPATLDPRADTETLVDEALSGEGGRILDLGTGTGAVIITLLAERPLWHGVAVDVSKEALAVAEANGARHGVAARLQCTHSDWFGSVEGRFDLIVSNPPYIPAAVIPALDPDVKDFDPHLALDGGDDGLRAYRAIATSSAAHLKATGRVIVEIGAGQQADVTAIFTSAGFMLRAFRRDLGGHVRAVAFGLPPL